LHGGQRRTLAQVNAFFTSVEQEFKKILLRNKHVADDFSGKLSFVEFCISDHANEDVGVLVKLSLARVLPTAFTDKRTDLDYYIKEDDYLSICTFRDNGLDTVKEYEMLVKERLQGCRSAELVEGIIEEVAESMSRYADQAQKIKNSDSILQWRIRAILMIDQKITTEMTQDSESNYLPGATLPEASTVDEKRNLLLNILLLGTVKFAYPPELLDKFGVDSPDVRDHVLRKYNGLLFLVRSLLSDLEKNGSIQFRDAIMDNAKRLLNMEHYDFDSFLDEEEIEKSNILLTTETQKGQNDEDVVPSEGSRVDEQVAGNDPDATQAIFHGSSFMQAVVGLHSLRALSPQLTAPDESGEAGEAEEDSTGLEVSHAELYDAFSKDKDFAAPELCTTKEDDMTTLSEDEDTGSEHKRQKKD